MRKIGQKLGICILTAAMLVTSADFTALAAEVKETAGKAWAKDVSAGEAEDAENAANAAEETAIEYYEVENEIEEVNVMADSAGNIASGSYGNITWVIDSSGKLTVEGTGEFGPASTGDVRTDKERAPWSRYNSLIVSAKIKVTGMVDASYMLWDCTNLRNVDISEFNTNSVINMRDMFCGCSNLTSLNLSNFDTGIVTDMRLMFWGCSSLTSLDVSNFDTSKVTDMMAMFHDCCNLTALDVSNFDTSNVMDMSFMFRGCSSLTALDVSNFDTNKVLSMEAMFHLCSSLTALDVSSFDTRNVIDMSSMFNGCNSLMALDVSKFDTSKVTKIGWMFSSCSSLKTIDVSKFDTSKVMEVEGMFSGCSNLATIYAPYNVTQKVNLPVSNSGDVWYRSDGSVATQLPQNLSYSVVLGKNYIPKETVDNSPVIIGNIKEWNGHTYAVYSGCDSWNEAQAFCKKLGGHLATITSEAENTALYSFVSQLGCQDVYFGLTDNIEEGKWEWVTGETVEYLNWHHGEPNSENPNEDYAMFYHKFSDGSWNDGDFNEKIFLCEWDKKLDEEDIPDITTTNIDEAIIAEVRKYTANIMYAQWKAILDSDLSHEEKVMRLNELSHNNGFTDVNEGIKYISEVSSHRRDYLFLTTNENYCAFDWWYWLNATVKGRMAQGLLYADGLIFNSELTSYLDWSKYATGSYPGVEKCKTMLKDFMEDDEDEAGVVEVAKTSKKICKGIDTALKLNEIKKTEEINELMSKIMHAQTVEQTKKYQQQLANSLIKEARIQQKIESNGEVKLYLGATGISKAMNYVTPIISVAAATTEDIVDIINLENEIAKYQEYDNFLTTVYSSVNVSTEMRIAAYQLHDSIENGYMEKVRSILTNFIKFETKMIIDKDMLKTYLESKGGVLTGVSLLGEAFATIKLAAVISNIVINTGDFVKEAAYTMAYADLATEYTLILQRDRDEFQKNPSTENAWKFYEDYNLLWRLRYKGEKQYLKMNVVKMFIFGRIKTYGYTYKENLVNDTLVSLKRGKFELANSNVVPTSVQYEKKSVIKCPVDILIYTKNGDKVAELRDGIISDTENKYGRFSVFFESYSGEYAKVICESGVEELNICIVAKESGLVDYVSARRNTSNMLSFNNLQVEFEDIIDIKEDKYLLIRGDGGEEISGSFDVLTEEYVKPESVLVEKESVELQVGEKCVVRAVVLPGNTTNKTVRWYCVMRQIIVPTYGSFTAD